MTHKYGGSIHPLRIYLCLYGCLSFHEDIRDSFAVLQNDVHFTVNNLCALWMVLSDWSQWGWLLHVATVITGTSFHKKPLTFSIAVFLLSNEPWSGMMQSSSRVNVYCHPSVRHELLLISQSWLCACLMSMRFLFYNFKYMFCIKAPRNAMYWAQTGRTHFSCWQLYLHRVLKKKKTNRVDLYKGKGFSHKCQLY